MLVLLGWTKTGQRRGQVESSSIFEKRTIELCGAVIADRPPEQYVFMQGRIAFYKLFKRYIAKLHLNRERYTPYSIRRGAATAAYLETHNLNKLLLHFRWQNIKTARLYVDEAMAHEAETKLTKRQQSALRGGVSLLNSVLGCAARPFWDAWSLK